MDIKMNAEALISSLQMQVETRPELAKAERELGFSVFLSLDTEEYYMVSTETGKEIIRISAVDKGQFHKLADCMNEYAEAYLKKTSH